MKWTLVAMTLSSSMILVDQTAVPLVAPMVFGAVSAGIALLGAVVSLFLVRKSDRVRQGPVFSRRSRWIFAS